MDLISEILLGVISICKSTNSKRSLFGSIWHLYLGDFFFWCLFNILITTILSFSLGFI